MSSNAPEPAAAPRGRPNWVVLAVAVGDRVEVEYRPDGATARTTITLAEQP